MFLLFYQAAFKAIAGLRKASFPLSEIGGEERMMVEVKMKESSSSSGSRLSYFQENGKGYYLQSLEDVGIEQGSGYQG